MIAYNIKPEASWWMMEECYCRSSGRRPLGSQGSDLALHHGGFKHSVFTRVTKASKAAKVADCT
jgi:hypothetical protein